jgi:hypothetical protein
MDNMDSIGELDAPSLSETLSADRGDALGDPKLSSNYNT